MYNFNNDLHDHHVWLVIHNTIITILSKNNNNVNYQNVDLDLISTNFKYGEMIFTTTIELYLIVLV